jgi:4-amino-4-deoxy-L-arabinose transferase-like glycosyltransferase
VDAADLIAEWEAYFVASAGAAAVLLGLVFVALSMHFERRRGRVGVQGLAIQSAASLFYALLVSLAMLVPQGRPTSQGVILVAVALFGVWTSGVAVVEARRSETPPISMAFRFVLPLAVMVVLLGAAGALVGESRFGVPLVGGVVFLHIVVGTQNAWDLFLLNRPGESGDSTSSSDRGHVADSDVQERHDG